MYVQKMLDIRNDGVKKIEINRLCVNWNKVEHFKRKKMGSKKMIFSVAVWSRTK